MELDIKQIMDRLPHRYPMLLVDRVLEMVPGKSIVAIKNVSMNEPFFTGHFPHHPVMPGVLRSEEHTSELQSLMRISYAVFCLKKKTNTRHNPLLCYEYSDKNYNQK